VPGRATAHIEDIWREKIRGCSYRDSTSLPSREPTNLPGGSPEVRYVLIATNFAFAAKGREVAPCLTKLRQRANDVSDQNRSGCNSAKIR
jgi:hypothetical protein